MIAIVWIVLFGIGLILFVIGRIIKETEGSAVSFFGLGMMILFGILFGSRLIATVDAGEVLVPIQFGRVLEPIQTEGVTIISPFSSRVRMPIRTVEISFLSFNSKAEEQKGDTGLQAIQALSSEGAQVGVDVTVLYHVDPTMVDLVYRTVKTNWEDVLVIPHIRNTVRDCLPNYSFEEARTSKRGEAQHCMLDRMQTALASRGIVVEDVLLRELKADSQLQAAIDAKLEAQSNAQRAEFIQREAVVTAETKRIEAAGLANAAIEKARGEAAAIVAVAEAEAKANDLIAASLTPELLQLRIYEQLGDKTVVITDGTTAPLPILPLG